MVLSQTKLQERKDAEVLILLLHYRVINVNREAILIVALSIFLPLPPLPSFFFQVLAEAKRINESRIILRVSVDLDFFIFYFFVIGEVMNNNSKETHIMTLSNLEVVIYWHYALCSEALVFWKGFFICLHVLSQVSLNVLLHVCH